MKRELIDPFIEKISMKVINNSGSPGLTNPIQNEYLSLIESIKTEIPTSYNTCRIFCYFSLRLNQLLSIMDIHDIQEKKRRC